MTETAKYDARYWRRHMCALSDIMDDFEEEFLTKLDADKFEDVFRAAVRAMDCVEELYFQCFKVVRKMEEGEVIFKTEDDK